MSRTTRRRSRWQHAGVPLLATALVASIAIVVDATALGTLASATTTQGITYVAGNYTACSSSCSSGVAATSSILYQPIGMAVDTHGNRFIADYHNDVVWMVAAQNCSSASNCGYGLYGLSSTVAGDAYLIAGQVGHACPYPWNSTDCKDGSPGPSAYLNAPTALALDPAGDLYISDTGDQVIRELSPATGTISDFAGDYQACSTSCDESNGNPKTAGFYYPYGLAWDQQDQGLYIADGAENSVRRVENGVVSTVVDASYGSCSQSPCGDGGTAANATLDNPTDVAVDSAGNLYIADYGDDVVRMVPAYSTYDYFGANGGHTMAAGDIYKIAGTYFTRCTSAAACGDGGVGTSGEFGRPYGIAVDNTVAPGDSPDVFVSDQTNDEVREIAGSYPIGENLGYLYAVAGQYAPCPTPPSSQNCGDDTESLSSASLTGPDHLALDSSGDLYVADSADHVIREITGETFGSPVPIPVPLDGGAPTPQELAAANPGMRCAGQTQPWTDPPQGLVNPEDGAFSYQKTLLSIPNRDLPLQVVEHYDSALAQSSTESFNGWNSDATTRLLLNDEYGTSDTGYYTVVEPDGAEAAFELSGGSYQPVAPRITATLSYASGQYSFTTGGQFTYTFDSSGVIEKVADVNGNSITYAYNAGGQLTSMTDEAGRSLSFTYDSDPTPHIDQVTGPDSRTLELTWDSSTNDLLSIEDPTSAVTSYGYSSHLMTAITTPDDQGASPAADTTITYDSENRITSEDDPLGYGDTYSYSGTPGTDAGGTTTATDADGNAIEYHYVYGELASKVQGAGSADQATTHYTYDPTCGAVATVLDPNGNESSYTYDAAGEMLSATNGAGDTTTWSYTGEVLPNEATKMTDPSGNVTTYSYGTGSPTAGNDGLLVAKTQGYGTTAAATWSYSYDAHGDLAEVVDPNEQSGGADAGSDTTYGYDSYGERTSMTTPSGETTYRYTCSSGCVSGKYFDDVGLLYSEVAPLGNVSGATPADYTTSYAYDADGRQIAVTYPPPSHGATSATSSSTYDADGNLTESIDRSGDETLHTYDAADELTGTTTGYGTTSGDSVSYTYDHVLGQVATYKDANGNTTSYSYDALNRLSQQSTPGGQVTSYAYDGAGNLRCRTQPNGSGDSCSDPTNTSAMDYTYDGANRLVGVTYNNGETGTSYTYYRNGLRESMTDGVGTTSYSYDALDRLTGTTDGNGSTVGYAYDASGNVTCMSYPISSTQSCSSAPSSTNTVVDYTYDASNQMTALTDWMSSGNSAFSFGYDANGDQTSLDYPSGSGASMSLGYNDLGALTSQTITDPSIPGSPFTVTFDRNASERLSGGTLTGGGAGSRTYNPDEQVTASGSIVDSNPVSYGYNPDGSLNCVTATNTSGYTCSNQNSGYTTTLSYNTNDQVTAMTPPSPAIATGYAYDDAGERTTTTQGSTTTTYQWNLQGELCWSYTGTSSNACSSPPTGASTYTYNGDGLRMSDDIGGTSQNFVWDTQDSVPRIVEDGTSAYIYGPDTYGAATAPLAQITGSTTQYIGSDISGAREVLNSDGSASESKLYNSYGSVTTAGTGSTPFGFAGGYTDPSGLIYFDHRYYDPNTAQFISVDPLADVTHQPYEYANDDPFDQYDPSGLCVDQCKAIAAASEEMAKEAGEYGIPVSDLSIETAIALAGLSLVPFFSIVPAEETLLLIGLISQLGLLTEVAGAALGSLAAEQCALNSAG